jgi:hypothetical protein
MHFGASKDLSHRKTRCERFAALYLAACLFSCLTGCKAFAPSNDRDWAADQAVLSTAEFAGDEVQVCNVRFCNYHTSDNYDLRHEDRTYRLADLETVDFIVVPFGDMPNLAHTMLSFGFKGENYLAVSVEIRKEKGERYSALKGLLRQYELMYVVADERDLIKVRSNLRLEDVYIYRAKATPAQARDLFVDVMRRVNKLAAEPEFYDAVTNNCTTNIVQHINHLSPGRIQYSAKVLLPGHSDRLAYDLGLIESDTDFERTRLRARINELAYAHRDSPDFSAMIRR